MTTRDQARPSERPATGRDGRERVPPPPLADTGPRLGEVLLDARERKGVDLYRAERDTKIRAKYLAALERGDYVELPGSVYTKGFLRNYALYLNLDPEAVLTQYRREYGANRPSEPVTIVPRALEAPRSGFTITPGLVVGLALLIGVIAFGGYIALQFMRFVKPPSLAVTQPVTAVWTAPAGTSSTVLAGTSDPGVTVTITGAGQQTYRLTADTTGHWQQLVQLVPGPPNQFTISATDPTTTNDSPTVHIAITVPVPETAAAPTLTVTSPTDGAAVGNGAIPLQGTTTAKPVTVSAAYKGPASGSGTSATPKPSASVKPAATPSAPADRTITVGQDGTFSGSYQLSPGTWSLTITATGDQSKTTTEIRTVTVAFTGVNLVVEIKDSKAWLKVWVDGKVDPDVGDGGTVFPVGKTLTFTAKTSVEVRTGSSGSTYFTLNGTSLGALGAPGVPETWLFQPPAAPKQTDRH